MGLDTAVARVAKKAQAGALLIPKRGVVVPVESKVRSGHDLDEVHEVVVGVVRLLVSVVEGVAVVVSPGLGPLRHLLGDGIGQLGTETEIVDDVGEVVLGVVGRIPVVLEIVDVHVAVAEAAARRKVEVSNDLVDAETTLDAASLLALLLQLLGVMLAQTLLDILALTERPRSLRIRLSNLLASVTAAGFLGVGRGRGAIAGAAVVGVQVLGGLVAGVAFGGTVCQPLHLGAFCLFGGMGAAYRLKALTSMTPPPSF